MLRPSSNFTNLRVWRQQRQLRHLIQALRVSEGSTLIPFFFICSRKEAQVESHSLVFKEKNLFSGFLSEFFFLSSILNSALNIEIQLPPPTPPAAKSFREQATLVMQS